MASTNGNGSPETLTSTAHGSAARCVARAVITAFEACEDGDVPLSQLQKVAVLEAALREFDGFGVHLTSVAMVGRLLRDLDPGR